MSIHMYTRGESGKLEHTAKISLVAGHLRVDWDDSVEEPFRKWFLSRGVVVDDLLVTVNEPTRFYGGLLKEYSRSSRIVMVERPD